MPEPGEGAGRDRKLPNAPPAGKSTRGAYTGKLMPAPPSAGPAYRRQAAEEGLEARVGAQAESVVAGGDETAEFLE